jgi:hypothetical protein
MIPETSTAIAPATRMALNRITSALHVPGGWGQAAG